MTPAGDTKQAKKAGGMPPPGSPNPFPTRLVDHPRELTKQNKTKQNAAVSVMRRVSVQGDIVAAFCFGENFWTDFEALPQPRALGPGAKRPPKGF